MNDIKECIVKIVMGEKGNTIYFWSRFSRTNLEKISFQVSKVNNFYYAKVYHYVRDKRKKGNGTTEHQIGYVYWKDGVLTWVKK